MKRENQVGKLILSLIGFFYLADLLLDLFPSEQYIIERDWGRGILNTVIFWLPPFVLGVYIFLKRRELAIQLWREDQVALIGVILLVITGLSQSILKMVYGAVIPPGPFMIALLITELHAERAFYLQSRLLLLLLKAIGVLLVLAGMTLDLSKRKPRVGKSIWVLLGGMAAFFVYALLGELNVILGSF